MDNHLLVSELQALSLEAKRRHTEVKDASDKALDILKGAAGNRDVLLRNADALLLPITLGCKSKTPKVIGIAITALQRLVALGGVPTASLSPLLHTLGGLLGQGVDIQLKILQALLSILTYNRDAHDEVLGNGLLLCFKLQDARVSVVSSTAAATLRQAVMLVFDRLSTDESAGETPTLALQLPDPTPTEVHVTPSAMDAYCVLSDLCLLTARSGSGGGSGLLGWGGSDKEKPKLLKLTSLQRTFGLELIESILSGYEDAVKQRPELLHLLSHSLAPLLLKLLAEKPTFPVALRVCRLIFLLIRSLMEQLPKEVEMCLLTLIRLGMGDAEEDGAKKENVQPWFRVLALEIIRGICGDGKLLQSLYSQFDQNGEPKLFSKLVSSLSRLMNEKPNLLGVSDQMHGLGVPTGDVAGSSSGYLDIGFGMVATAANVGVSTVSSMMGSQGGGLGTQSGLKLKLIEQHDKAEAPIIPETYIYLLALQSVNAIANGIYNMTTRIQASSPALVGMAESAWPALLAALSFAMATNLSDALFAEILQALQDFTLACNTLSLDMPRNAFLSTIGKYAVPPPVVSAMQAYLEGGAGRKDSVLSPDGLGITAALGVGASTTPPSLSERNLACLKSTIATARLLSADLNTAWHDVLEILQNATFMLGAKRPSATRRGTTAGSPKMVSRTLDARQSIDEPRSEVFEGIDSEEIAVAINVLFDSTTQMDDTAFTTFLSSLCQLSSEMIGVDALKIPAAGSRHSGEVEVPGTPRTPRSATFPMSPSPDNRRRTSGFTITSSAKSGEKSFSLGKLRTVGMLNINRLVNKDPEGGWKIFTGHLLGVARHGGAPSTVRIQASEILSDFLLGSMRVAKDSKIQHSVFEVLVGQVDVEPVSHLISTDYDVRSAGYQTLNQILESSGHSLEVGWTTIFGMLNDVCHQPNTDSSDIDRENTQHLSASRPSAYHKGDANLVRIAFPSLNLICTDFLSSLDQDSMRQCIACLGCFGRQKEDVNITLSSIGLMWNVSDAVQADSKDLWLKLLLQLLELARDSRSEVRGSSMQTLFKCVELYGATLSSDLWEEVWWKVVYPVLQSSKGDDTQVLALVSVGNIFSTFLDKLATLPSIDKITSTLLESTQESFETGSPQVHIASLKALERILIAVAKGKTAVLKVWETFLYMGTVIQSKEGYSQESLVALVRIAGLLHDHLDLAERSYQTRLSEIIRTIGTYAQSPEYRPDVDVMSPLQKSIFELLSSSSTKLRPTIVLADLAMFASLPYRQETTEATNRIGSGKYTYVGMSKAVMPRIVTLVETHMNDKELLKSGTIEKVLEAYQLPIGLKYECPPSSRFNDDPPLWKTAMMATNGVLRSVLPQVSSEVIGQERAEAVWTRTISILGCLLLVDNTGQTPDDERYVLDLLSEWRSTFIPSLVGSQLPRESIQKLAEILRKGSILYRYDVDSVGGTTASAIAGPSEEMAYWSFDLLVSIASSAQHHQKDTKLDGGRAKSEVGDLMIPALIQRFEETLRRFVQDIKLRGRLPLERVRQDEILYVLRQLVTLSIPVDNTDRSDGTSALKSLTPTSHLLRFYPLLIEILSFERCIPVMWVLPSEYARLFPPTIINGATNGTSYDLDIVNQDQNLDALEEDEIVDVGDGSELIEVSARDLAKRCLEIIGLELGLGLNLDSGI